MKRATTSLPTRLAGEQHGRLGARHPRGLGEHIFPPPRAPDHAPVSAGRFELACQRGHLRFEPRRHFARLRVAPRRFGQPLVRDRQRQVVGDAPPEIDVIVQERIGLPRQEEERPEHLAAKRQHDAQRRFHAKVLEDAPANSVARHLRIDVVDDVGAALQLSEVVAREGVRPEQGGVVHLCAGERVDPERRAVGAPGGHDEHVVREPSADDVGDVREYRPQIQRFRHGVQEAAQAVDPLASERLAIDDRGMFERDAEQIDDAVEERLVFVGEGVVLRRGDPHRAAHIRVPWRAVQRIRERSSAVSALIATLAPSIRRLVIDTSPSRETT